MKREGLVFEREKLVQEEKEYRGKKKDEVLTVYYDGNFYIKKGLKVYYLPVEDFKLFFEAGEFGEAEVEVGFKEEEERGEVKIF